MKTPLHRPMLALTALACLAPLSACSASSSHPSASNGTPTTSASSSPSTGAHGVTSKLDPQVSNAAVHATAASSTTDSFLGLNIERPTGYSTVAKLTNRNPAVIMFSPKDKYDQMISLGMLHNNPQNDKEYEQGVNGAMNTSFVGKSTFTQKDMKIADHTVNMSKRVGTVQLGPQNSNITVESLVYRDKNGNDWNVTIDQPPSSADQAHDEAVNLMESVIKQTS